MSLLFSHYNIDLREPLNIRPLEQSFIPSIDPGRTVPSYTCCYYFTVYELKMDFVINKFVQAAIINSLINLSKIELYVYICKNKIIIKINKRICWQC